MKDDVTRGSNPYKRPKNKNKNGEEPSVIRFGEAECQNHDVPDAILKPTREAPKISWPVEDGASLVNDRSPIRSVA